MTYDKYVKDLLTPELIKLRSRGCKKRKLYPGAKKELDELLGGIPHEIKAYETACEKNVTSNKETSTQNKGKKISLLDLAKNEVYSIGSCSFSFRSPTDSSDSNAELDKKSDLYLLFARYDPIYLAPLQILVDHLLRSLGCVVWYHYERNKQKKSDFHALLYEYAKKETSQKELSVMLYVRECADYAQAFINARNRIMDILLYLATASKDIMLTKEMFENHEKKKVIDKYRRKLFKVTNGWFPDMKDPVQTITWKIRNPWVHSQSEVILEELANFNIFNHIQESFRSILLQYEGLFRWYYNPDKHQIILPAFTEDEKATLKSQQ